ncbi:MAG: ATP-binding protein [Clostridia bacterium]
MIEKESIPFAPHLIESMRSLGYSFETAIADLVDNSISANASKIDIFLTPDIDPKLIIFDNGCGMDEKTLEEALRYGSMNPLEERDENDLGRFGLGLKAASLSQCRKLIVASKKNNRITCFSWDIDKVLEKKGWILLQYDNEEIKKQPMINLFDEVESGTYLLLKKFDRIASSTGDLCKTINNYMGLTIDHLALVFHRFLADKVNIFVNNSLIKPIDPFLINHKSTQILREQSFEIDGSEIVLQPYILPYINKLSLEDIKKVGGKNDLKTNQGFYVYRNKRLIIWGTWFKLARKEELGKLARIRVDIPSSLDYMWSIDIKKSSANLPDLIKKNLYNAIENSIFASKSVHEYRGRKENNNDINYVWERISLREGCYEYKINRELPQLQMLESTLNQEQLKVLSLFLDNIENSFPSSSIYLDASKGDIKTENIEIESLYEEIKTQLNYCDKIGINSEEMLKVLLKTEPYCNYEKLKDMFQYEVI